MFNLQRSSSSFLLAPLWDLKAKGFGCFLDLRRNKTSMKDRLIFVELFSSHVKGQFTQITHKNQHVFSLAPSQ